MNEYELVSSMLKTPLLLIAVVAQGFVFALLFLGIAYKFLNKVADKYIQASERQSAAMAKIADSVSGLSGGMEILKEQTKRWDDFAVEVRITLRSVEDNMERIDGKINRLLSGLETDRRVGDRRGQVKNEYN
jgi:hypothetical protein